MALGLLIIFKPFQQAARMYTLSYFSFKIIVIFITFLNFEHIYVTESAHVYMHTHTHTFFSSTWKFGSSDIQIHNHFYCSYKSPFQCYYDSTYTTLCNTVTRKALWDFVYITLWQRVHSAKKNVLKLCFIGSLESSVAEIRICDRLYTHKLSFTLFVFKIFQ